MSGLDRWEDMLWDRLPHMIKYSRTSLDWVDRYVKLTMGLQRLHKDYAKGLSKLVKAQRDRGVDGRSMGRCWVGVIGHLGSVSEKHRQLATVLGDIGKKYGEEADLLTEEQRTLEENSRKFQSDLDSSILQLEKSKEKFFRRQIEAEKAEEALVRGEDDEKTSAEELGKIKEAADERRAKYNKARDEYSSQLSATNNLQREFYEDTWPSILAGMRGVAERGVECIISLLRRLDLLAREELGDLGLIADDMEGSMYEDFDSFLNWVKSGNPPPQDFIFEESCKPGTLSFSTIGTLRKSLSRASLRITSTPLVGRGFGSRLSLRSPYPARNTTRFYSAKENRSDYYTRTSVIPEHNESDNTVSRPESNNSFTESKKSAEHLNDSGISNPDNNPDPEDKEESDTGDIEIRNNSKLNEIREIARTEEKKSNGIHREETIVEQAEPDQDKSNGRESYDDRMNPFTESFEN